MIKMRDLKDNIRGVKCDATKEAWAFLKINKRKPYLLETPTSRFIRVTLDGTKYDYSPTTGAWSPTADRGRRGRWRESQSVLEFYTAAARMSAGIWPPSQRQIDYLAGLESLTGQKSACSARHDIKVCSFEISRLKELRESKGETPKKPRVSAKEWSLVMARNQQKNTQEQSA